MTEDEKCHKAAVCLQKYFRMWKAQSNYVKMQLYSDTGEKSTIQFENRVRIGSLGKHSAAKNMCNKTIRLINN